VPRRGRVLAYGGKLGREDVVGGERGSRILRIFEHMGGDSTGLHGGGGRRKGSEEKKSPKRNLFLGEGSGWARPRLLWGGESQRQEFRLACYESAETRTINVRKGRGIEHEIFPN